jgi:tRNA (guanine-N7-)-methyltransferase
MRLRKVKNASNIINNSDYIINRPQELKGNWGKCFSNENPIHIEIGMGKGQFIINMAIKYPEINFIGIEKYDSVLVRAVEKLENQEIKPNNLKLILLDAKDIAEIFDREISVIYLNFSDPWPKAKHTKRRLTSIDFLEKFDLVFKNEKMIIQKTDNIDLFQFSIESLKEYGYEITNITYDLQRDITEDNIMTEYEEKFQKKGILICKLTAKK